MAIKVTNRDKQELIEDELMAKLSELGLDIIIPDDDDTNKEEENDNNNSEE